MVITASLKQHRVFYLSMLVLLLITILLTCHLQMQKHAQQLQLIPPAFADIILWNSVMPRIVMAVLVGGTLGLATMLLQQMTHNTLASDSTLAINGGAQLALMIVSIFFPSMLVMVDGVFWAMGGALLTLAIIFSLSRNGYALPLRMMLVGMALNLFFSAIAIVFMLYYIEESKAVIQWAAGSLVEDGWRDVLLLMVANVAAMVLITLLAKPLQALDLEDGQARSLGVSVDSTRWIVLLLVSFLVAVVVSLAGMIGFIGLAAATIVHQCRFPTIGQRLLAVYCLAGLLLLLSDTLLQYVQSMTAIYVPVGVATAFLGAPLLLYVLFRSYQQHPVQQDKSLVEGSGQCKNVSGMMGFMSLLLVLLIVLNLLVVHVDTGYVRIFSSSNMEAVLPRMLTALAAGMILAIAGFILQRTSNNALASPELLGVNAGAAIFILCALLLTSVSLQYLWIIGIFGALCTLGCIILINLHSQLQPDRVLISGIAISTLMDALIRLFMTNGDPRAQFLMAWLSGSTYYSSLYSAVGAISVALLAILLVLALHRVMTLFAFSPPIARALGLNILRNRILMLLIGGVLAGIFTILMGPLSFVGLISPHLARLLGCRTVGKQLMAAVLIGANLMLLADWLGRNLLFPYEIPASLVASIIGACCFLVLLKKA